MNTEDNLKKEKKMEELNTAYFRGYQKANSETLKKVFEDELIFLNKLKFDFNNFPETRREIDNRIEKLKQKLKELETK